MLAKVKISRVCEASPGILCPDVEFSVQERHGFVGACTEEGHRNDIRGGKMRKEEKGF